MKPGIWFPVQLILYFASNMNKLAVLGTFEVLTGSCKAMESKNGNKQKIGLKCCVRNASRVPKLSYFFFLAGTVIEFYSFETYGTSIKF